MNVALTNSLATRSAPAPTRAAAHAKGGTAAVASPVRAAATTTQPAEPSVTTGTTTAFWIAIRIQVSSPDAAGTTAATPPATEPAAEGARTDAPGRAHVAQSLHKLAKAVGRELRAILKEAGGSDPELRRELKAIGREFRQALRTTFHAAAAGDSVDPSRLLAGVEAALRQLADRLGALIDEDAPAAPADPVEKPVEPQDPAATPVVPTDPAETPAAAA